MRPALFTPSSDPQREGLRRRAIAIVLTILAHALLLLMLLRLAPEQFHLPAAARLTTFSLVPGPDAAAKRETGANRAHRRSGGAPHTPPPPKAEQQPKIPPPPVPPPPLNILPMSSQEMAVADISHLPSDRGAHASGQGQTTGSGAGPDSGGSDSPSQIVGGERYYQVAWYRRPTDAEIDYYMPKSGPHTGWAEIGCRTVERFHVDDCQELGEGPPGSGFSRAMRQMAWQFLVRPPRVGGKSLVGAPVIIRLDFYEQAAK